MKITKTCNTCEHYPNDKHCIGCEWDEGERENTKWELKKNPIVIERAVLDKIRAEIEPKCDRINSLVSVLPYTAHREIQELLCEIMDLCKAESEDKE